MPRIALGVEYDGSHYCGWQRQRHSDSVQARVESALSIIANEPITIHCAGRTDTGVHATGQVAHFDTNVSRSPSGWVLGCNAKMPASVSLRWASEVDDEFHARFSALERRYRYLIFNSRARSALYAQRACVVHAPLDEDLMSAAAQQLLGEHDIVRFGPPVAKPNTRAEIFDNLELAGQAPTSLLILPPTHSCNTWFVISPAC